MPILVVIAASDLLPAVPPGCALGIAAGLFFFATLDAVLLARALGAFIILYAIYSLWMTTRPPGSTPPVPRALLRPLASFFSGAVGTLFGSMASIFFAMYLDASGANKQTFRAALSAMLLTLSVARTVGYAAVNELTLDSFILCAATIPAMGIGLLVGDKIYSGLARRRFSAWCARLFFFVAYRCFLDELHFCTDMLVCRRNST